MNEGKLNQKSEFENGIDDVCKDCKHSKIFKDFIFEGKEEIGCIRDLEPILFLNDITQKKFYHCYEKEEDKKQEPLSFTNLSNKEILGNANLLLTFKPASPPAFIFEEEPGRNNGFSLTWNDGYLDIIYDKNTTPSSAAILFFETIKQYVKNEYHIIKKEKVK